MAGDDAASLRRIEGIVGGSDAITIRRIRGEWWDLFEDDGGAVLANVGRLEPARSSSPPYAPRTGRGTRRGHC